MAEITRVPDFWNPATGYSDDVLVKNASTSVAVTVKKGTILSSDGAGNYSVVTTMTAAPTNRIAVALEDIEIAKSGTATIKAIKAGVVYVEEMLKAGGYASSAITDAVLDEAGGKSNIAFVHVKEVE